MNSKELCGEFLNKLGYIQNISLENGRESKFAKCEQFSSYYGQWIEQLQLLHTEQLDMFKLALKEYELSLMFAVDGLYKQAMDSVRFSLEHSLFAIQLSSNELQYRLWKSHEKDENWSEIVHAEEGVFGKVFIRAFAAELEEHSASLQTLARDIYRECSEYVHGNYSVTQKTPLELEFNEALYDEFMDKADSVAYLITFALVIRYWDRLKSGELLAALENSIMSLLGTIPEILALYNN